MLKFDEKKQIESVAGALALRSRIEHIVDEICRKGYDDLYYLGIGGTYASCLQTVNHIREMSALPAYVENAAEYITRGNRRINEKTVVVISSVTGNTQEMVEAIRRIKKVGATVIGFVDEETAELAKMVDYEIAYPQNEQLKFFMVADRFMKNAGDFADYDRFYAEMDKYLPQALVEVAKAADNFGKEFAEKHKDDPIHYFIGAGNQYGATYSYAMCFWEEQHWLRSKSIHAGEFFHGTLEIIDRDTPVTVFLGEDAERPLAERVARFLPRVCANYTLIDTKDYPLTGISPEFRGHISHLVMRMITQRIDVHLELVNRHPMEIRRYYRQLDY
ncbi:MAG: SIS domain-containing protein [Firmicutes bacterium]|nr:SIS domain-containing protein [Bacillota bacterium]